MIEHARSLRATPVPAPPQLRKAPQARQRPHVRFAPGNRHRLSPKLGAGGASRRTTATRSKSPPKRATCANSATSCSTSRCSDCWSLSPPASCFGYEGNVIVIADGGPGVCSRVARRVRLLPRRQQRRRHLPVPDVPSRQRLPGRYLPNGQAISFASNIDYQAGTDLASGTWKPYLLEVNHPLRIGGDRVYLQGHGYAPTFTVTFPDGQKRTQTIQWRPDDAHTLLSSGVVRVDPPGGTYPNALERRKHQVAIMGLLAPTAQFDGTLLSSSYPHSRTRPSRSTSTAATPAWTQGARSRCSHSTTP